MSRIPRIFHFVFGLRKQREPFSVAYYLCLQSCRQVNRPEKIYFYYHYEPYGPYWEAIRKDLTLERVSLNPIVGGTRYRDRKIEPFRYAHHSDFIRLEKLQERGGVYADIDTLFVAPVPDELFDKPFVIGSEGLIREPNTGRSVPSLCNAFLMAERGSKFGSLWMDRMASSFGATWSNHSTLLPQRLSEEHPELVHVEPESSFFHFPSSVPGLAELLQGSVPIPDKVYSIHLWEHLWWDESRADFSPFSGSDLTERWVRESPATLAVAARRFLPPGSIAPDPPLVTRWKARLRAWLKKANQEARMVIGLSIYPLLRRVRPSVGKRLGWARGYRAHKAARRKFTFDNPMEESILLQVVQFDEYEIFEKGFAAEDVVIDIGAHIGSFSYACHWLGSRNICAFEADAANFARGQANLAGLEGLQLQHAAVFRSDTDSVRELLHSGPVFSNTGAGGVIFGENHYAALGHEQWKPTAETSNCPVIALDRILEQFDRVSLLKLDCEGSEYPILLTSKLLHKVDRIVGEYHVVPEDSMDLLVAEARVEGYPAYCAETLQKKLEDEGFEVTLQPRSGLGGFDARRRRE